MIIVVVGKHRNTTTWFSAVGEETARTATANHELRPQIARTATANRTTHHRKPHAPQPQTARTATANRSTATTNRNGTAVLTYF
jgi:hypothetical protein